MEFWTGILQSRGHTPTQKHDAAVTILAANAITEWDDPAKAKPFCADDVQLAVQYLLENGGYGDIG